MVFLGFFLGFFINSVPDEFNTPYAFDKKTPDLAQGLDFLRFLKGKQGKTKQTTKKNLGTPGSKFLIIMYLIKQIGYSR